MTLNFSSADASWMARCLDLADRARGLTAPNPLVGAVVVKEGKLVSEGYHLGPGQPHAEAAALTAAGAEAAGADLYVNLEPCCHYGRTPPCSQQIIAAGISRVVAALTDPNPKVAGGGFRQLQEAGIKVEIGLLEAAARRQNEIFLTCFEKDRPFVLWKTALSLDGRVAAKGGHSQWVTGSLARAEVHRLRAEFDGVMVGSGTIIADDPRLTARPLPPGFKQPARILLDRRGRISPQAAVFLTPESPVFWFIEEGATERTQSPKTFGDHVTVVRCPRGRMTPLWILQELRQRGITSLLFEGGPEAAAGFWQAQCIDKLLWFMAPKLVGSQGLAVTPPWNITDMAHAVTLKAVTAVVLGDDIRIEAYPPWSSIE